MSDRLLQAVSPLIHSEDPDARDLVIDQVTTPGGGGFSNGTWTFRARWVGADGPRQRRLVLRTPPDGPTLLHVPTLDLQADVMSALEDSPVPVPRVLWRGVETDGTPYYLMEHMSGRPGPDSPPYTRAGWILELAPAGRRRVHEAALEAMAAVHTIDYAALDIPSLECPGPGRTSLDLRLDFWAAHYDNAASRLGASNPYVERGLAWLQANRPTIEADPVLNWGDSRFGNVLFEEAGTEVVALLDWEFACIASPAFDVSHWLFADRFFTEGIGINRPDGFPTPAEQLEYYRQLTGNPLDDLPYYNVALAAQSAINMMRVAKMSLDAGWVEPEPGLGVETGGSLLLRRLLGDEVQGAGTYFAKGQPPGEPPMTAHP